MQKLNENWPIITKDTTVDKIFEIHRHIWDIVIENFMETGFASKPYTPYHADCALCEYNIIHKRPCRKCLVDWGVAAFGYPIKCTNNIDYISYCFSYSDEETLEALKKIRDIPRKKI